MLRNSPSRWFLALLPLILVLALSIPAARLALFATRPLSPSSPTETVVLVARGVGPSEIARQLETSKAISSAKDFHLLGKVLRKWKDLKTGEYLVTSGMNPLEIFKVLSSGISIQHMVTIREGANMYEVADSLEKAGLASREKVLTLCREHEFIKSQGFQEPLPPSLEGYLFPDTYAFTRVETPEAMIQAMIRRYRAAWTQVKNRFAAQISSLGLSEHQIVTLASIIEKETGAPEERPMISSVFHNRLRKKMRLQSDPTTIYGIWETYSGNIRKQDLLTPTPFNTYTVPSLPVGPISNPGSLALEAAVNPAQSEYLFFVSQNEGRHIFTRSYEEHNRAVRKFQLDPKAREGKSWRNLKTDRAGSGT
ncbi:MAG: endolytic transglycosylase MltG [Bdellovibrionales bacterium]|nr:endolytic transglycosylase MltG [Bdellovibrionales bacterium]